MFLMFLRSLYDPEIPVPQDKTGWMKWLADIRMFSVSAQVLHLLKQSGQYGRMPAGFRDRLSLDADSGMPQSWFFKRKESEVVLAFERREIPVIPLKGTRFSEKYFGHFAGRLTGDIDLLIHHSDLDRAISSLMEDGYLFDKIIHNHAVLCGHAAHQNPVVELHWTLDKAGWSDLSPEPFWQQASPIPPHRHVMELSATHTFYFMCLHAVRHRVDSPKYVLDIAQMLHLSTGEIDYDELLAQSASDKTFNRIRTALSIVYSALPHLHRLKPLPFAVRRSTWSYPAIRDAQLQVKSFRYYAYRLFFKYFIFDTWKHRWHAQRKRRTR